MYIYMYLEIISTSMMIYHDSHASHQDSEICHDPTADLPRLNAVTSSSHGARPKDRWCLGNRARDGNSMAGATFGICSSTEDTWEFLGIPHSLTLHLTGAFYAGNEGMIPVITSNNHPSNPIPIHSLLSTSKSWHIFSQQTCHKHVGREPSELLPMTNMLNMWSIERKQLI